jgi:hypothetical protein
MSIGFVSFHVIWFDYMQFYVIVWFYLILCPFIWFQLISIDFNLFHVIFLFHFFLIFMEFHLITSGFIWFLVISFYFTRFHVISFAFMWAFPVSTHPYFSRNLDLEKRVTSFHYPPTTFYVSPSLIDIIVCPCHAFRYVQLPPLHTG